MKEYLPRDWGTRLGDGTIGPRTGSDAEDYRWGLERFLKEARILAQFDHPNLVRVHRVFEARGTAYMVMEYVEGRTLKKEVAASGPLPEARVREVLAVNEADRPQILQEWRAMLERGAMKPPPAGEEAPPAAPPRGAVRVVLPETAYERSGQGTAGRRRRLGVVAAAGLAVAVLVVALTVPWSVPEPIPPPVPIPVPDPEPPPVVLPAERQAELRPPGRVFRDCPSCPELVVIPGGRFRMGSTDEYDGAQPVHDVTVASFALGRYEVTFEEFLRFRVASGWPYPDRNEEEWGWPGGPVKHVSWADVQAYLAWLSAETGKRYRLPSEAEWEYAARAGTETAYSWGNEIGDNRANCDGCGSRWDDEQTEPVGSFGANAWGLHDMHGNVSEFVEDCWHENYTGAPSDGTAWTSGGDCGSLVVLGGSYY